MSAQPEKQPDMDLCESCMGSGIEEGCDWSGESCHTCNGRGLVPCDCYDHEENHEEANP